MHLILVGINHETAPVNLREKLAFTEEQSCEILSRFKENQSISEIALLSTCNRTEIYLRRNPETSPCSHAIAAEVIRNLIEWKEARGLEKGNFYTLFDEEAARHLFRVSAGLESMIKGEAQVLAQVKEAYRIACRAESCAYFLHKLFHQAFRVGKRSRTETEIGIGAVSISLAAVEMLNGLNGRLGEVKALVIGAGEMASLTSEYLFDKGIGSLTITNRTFEKADELAKRLGAKAIPFDQIMNAISDSDVVITSTNAGQILVKADDVREIMTTRPERPLLLFDISVPRNIDPSLCNIQNATCYDVDDLKATVDKNLNKRNGEIPKVENIIEREIESFLQWYREMDVTPTIKDLLDQIDAMRREEIERKAKYFTPEQLVQVDLLTKNLVKKILHHPIKMLKNSGQSDIPGSITTADTVRQVFNLGAKPHD